MTLPALIFGALTATLCGALFHLWKGGGLGKLVLYQALAWLGFFGGHALAASRGWHWGMVGTLALLPGVLGAAVFLFVGHYLAQAPKA